ncbi:hypothetical protein HELRODRAFT_163707 [Helobdella robusta]|uniref:ETS domain-containing protein n=1 Tax=Helobdella robusta TaxID=6412 RepID=T1EUD7_HELRO|nr:hypothetical protein HELRODRAFT_163707 [Helobdella robusta]ESN96619.1 hypothetical protein HELRODRAFT_163707 [Helobdella robusta]
MYHAESLFIKVETPDDLNSIHDFLNVSASKDDGQFTLAADVFKKHINGSASEYSCDNNNNSLYEGCNEHEFALNGLKNHDDQTNGHTNDNDENVSDNTGNDVSNINSTDSIIINDGDDNNEDDDEDESLDQYFEPINLRIQQLDLSQPLWYIRDLLVSDGIIDGNVKKVEYWLQNNDKLDESKSLKWCCVEMEGENIQVNIDVRARLDNKKIRINISDILVPCDETSTDQVTTTIKPKRQRTVKTKPPPSVSNQALQSRQFPNWSADPVFKTIQVANNIPTRLEDWTCDHVRLWLRWASSHFPFDFDPHSDDINVTGVEVCQWQLKDAQVLAPRDVNNLFWTHIQLLKKLHIATLNDVQVNPAMNNPSKGRGLNGQVQLWQFLLEILIDQSHRHMVEWVGRDGEFHLINPEGVAQLWGCKKNRTGMTYEKMSRAMRYYYDGDIIHKVPSKRFHYKFVCDLRSKVGFSVSEIQDLVNSPTAAIESPDCVNSDRMKLQSLLETLRSPACLRRAVPINTPMINNGNYTNGTTAASTTLSNDISNSSTFNNKNFRIVVATTEQLQTISPDLWLNLTTQQQQQIVECVSHEQDVVSN